MLAILPYHHFGALILITALGITGLIAMRLDMKKKKLPNWLFFFYVFAIALLAVEILSGIYLYINGSKHLLWHYLMGFTTILGFVAFYYWYKEVRTPFRVFAGMWLIMLFVSVVYLLGLNGRF